MLHLLGPDNTVWLIDTHSLQTHSTCTMMGFVAPNLTHLDPNPHNLWISQTLSLVELMSILDEFYCNCAVDEVQIFEVELNKDEVKSLYDSEENN